jgi:hydrogenase small subunit
MAWAVVAAGTCATYGGIHAMAGNATGCMGLADYLCWNFRSRAGIPVVNVPGCPVQLYLGNGRVLETRHSPMFGAMK